MENEENANHQIFFCDTITSINRLTGNEFYFYSNDDADIYRKKKCNELQIGEANTGDHSELQPLIINDGDIKRNKLKNQKQSEIQTGKKKQCKVSKKEQGDTSNYFSSERTINEHVYEERERLVFEQEFNKVHDMYNVEEIMKIINKLNSIRKEIETVIYKKLEKKYSEFLTASDKIKDIEMFIKNINDLVVENTRELKLLQDKKYRQSLNIINLVTKKKKFQKINLVILTIYIIYICDRLIFKSILKKDYEYASLVYFELVNFIKANAKYLDKINCILHLKEKIMLEYFDRLKQKNQTSFVEFLFSNNTNKNFEVQLKNSFKIYYLLFKSKPSNFIENLLAFIYQCFRKISKQVIFSFLIVIKKSGSRDKQKKEEKKKENLIDAKKVAENTKQQKGAENGNYSTQDFDKKNSFYKEDIKKTVDTYELKTNGSCEHSPNDTPSLYENCMYEDINNKSSNQRKNIVQNVNLKKNEGTSRLIANVDDSSSPRDTNISDVTNPGYENRDKLKMIGNKTINNNLSSTLNNPNDTFEIDINHIQEEANFLFIPLNELAQKLNEKNCLTSLLKIYEIVFDVMKKYDSIIIYLLNYKKKEPSKGDSRGLKKEDTSLNHNSRDSSVGDDTFQFSKYHNNRGSIVLENEPFDEIGKMDKNDPEGENLYKYNFQSNETHILDDTNWEENLPQYVDHRNSFRFYDMLNEYKNEKYHSIISKYYQINDGSSYSPLIKYFVKNVDIENSTYAEYSLKIQERVESYLKNRNIQYDNSETYRKFALDNANKLISAKNKFLKNIEKVIKTIIEHIRFDNFNFHYIFRFAIVTIIFCVNSFLFENNCSNSRIYHLKKGEWRGICSTEMCNEKDSQNEDEKKEESPTLRNEAESHECLAENHQTDKKTETKKLIHESVQTKIKSTTKSSINSNFYGYKGKNNFTKLVKSVNIQSRHSSAERTYKSETPIQDNELNMKNYQTKNDYQSKMEETCMEYFLSENAPILLVEEKRTEFFHNLLKNNSIFEEMENKIKDNLHHFFYHNGKKLNDSINKDNWVRVPVKINQCIFKKKFHFFHIISFYKKTFYDFLNSPISENPLVNLNLKKLEEELCSEEEISEHVNIGLVTNLGGSKFSNEGAIEPNWGKYTKSDFDTAQVRKETNNLYYDKTCVETNLKKTKNMINNKEMFEIVNFDIVLSNSSNMLTCSLQNYLMFKELFPNLKDIINQYIFKIIDFYMYVLCSYFMKRETMEELLIDLKKYNDRLGINNIFFIIKKQEKYKQLYNFLIFYNEEIKKNADNYHFLYVQKNPHRFFQSKYNTTNCNINLKDSPCPSLNLCNFHTIYSSTCHYAISEKIISIESLYCLISKLKEEIMQTKDNSNKEHIDQMKNNHGHSPMQNEISNQEVNVRHNNSGFNNTSRKDNIEWDSFLPFFEQKLRIIDELRILVYCDSLYEIVDSTNYINEVVKLINDACNNYKSAINGKDDFDNLNAKKKFQTNMNQFMNLYINILNDAKRKIMFCCDGVVSVVVHYLLWNLINYIFNLNNIEIVHHIRSEVAPIIDPNNTNNSGGNDSSFKNENQVRTNQHVHTTGANTKGTEESIANLQRETKVLPFCNDAKFSGANLVSNNKSTLHGAIRQKVGCSTDSDNSSTYCGGATEDIINTLKYFFNKISNSIIQHITNLENEIEKYLSSSEVDNDSNCNTDIRNTVYMKLYKDLKDFNTERHNFYYIFLSKGMNYYDQYVDLHLYNLEKLDQLIKCANPDFFQYKHVHSVILKYHSCKLVPESYVAQYEMGILKEIQSKIISRTV
ncbi:hypothetical protein, conserved [Plasmodium gonderi]|uniref:Uncharacterized protein n=1 Tax=Plasmodium gonderi TaxID=77519 RepID=A0A1Y1J8N8_PLAGO|nr:hypothetical protein, conserved [Plasmodium gonderi]GAW78869.1 hypothetical protein, conserved [Plasmodium gonderi]